MAQDGRRTYLEQMRQMMQVLGRLTEQSIQPEATAQLLAGFGNWRRDAGFTN